MDNYFCKLNGYVEIDDKNQIIDFTISTRDTIFFKSYINECYYEINSLCV